VCTTGDPAHIDTMIFTTTMIQARIIAAVKNIDASMLTRMWQELEYRTDVCNVTRGVHIENLQLSLQFSCYCEHFHSGKSFGFLVINICNHGEYYKTPRMFQFNRVQEWIKNCT
jgi:hypothetical protein